MKEIKISMEQKEILEKLTVRQLEFFSSISQHKNFQEFSKVVNLLIDVEKNKFFGENEVDEGKLALTHAYSRGSVGGVIQLLKLISIAQHELERRTEKE